MSRFFQSVCIFLALQWAFTAVSFDARAHGSMPAGLTPFLVDGDMVGGATSLGLVLHVEGQPTWWTALRVHGTLNFFAYSASGEVLVGTSDGLMVTSDGGCSYESHSETLADADVLALGLHPATSRPHLIATATHESTNWIYNTTDGGDTWTAIPGTETQERYLAITLARSTQRYVALRTSTNAGDYELHELSVSGAHLSATPVAFHPTGSVRMLAPCVEDGCVYLAEFIPDEDPPELPAGTPAPGTDTLFVVDLTSAEATQVAHLTGSNRFFSGGSFAGGSYVTDFQDRFLRISSNGLEEVGDEIRYCVDDSLSAEYLWACGRRPQEHTFYRTTDGVSWEGLVLFDDIAVGVCPDKDPGDPAGPGDGVDMGGDPAGSDSTGDSNEEGESIPEGDTTGSSAGEGAAEDSTKPMDSSGCAATPVSLAGLFGFLFVWRRLSQ